LKAAMSAAFFGYLAFVAALLSLRLMRKLYERFLPRIRIAYVGGPTVVSPVGATLLEISRSFGIPHASVCGGRARCSTCRVRFLDGLDTLPVPNDAERLVLERVGAAPNVRLACQLRPNGNIRIATLLPANRVLPEDVMQLDKFLWGVEQNVAILFADLRGFTRFSERRLPYDVVFFLNQYLGQVGQAIEDVGGYVDKFMGDGIMAIFGLDRGPEVAARQALAAAKSIGGVLDALNSSLRTELPERLEIGIGIHTGPAILGRVGVAGGAGATQRITALGDTVNAASRLESSCKEHKAQLIVSADTAAAASLDLSGYQRERIQVKGRSEPLDVFVVRRAVDVPLAGPWSASPTRAKNEAAVRPQTAA
ncbi:MAG: adenylate/guanylate cyclase domain-containing protein, partial [Pseudomonadota bacterium]|nr:adenylate/guanylate cyclase domain-containing protein [Pseudomonadota bacterium]